MGVASLPMDESTPQSDLPIEGSATEAEPVADAPPVPAAVASTTRPWWIPASILAAIAVVGFLVATQIYLVSAVSSTQDELDATRSELEDTYDEVASLESQVAAVGSVVEVLAAAQTTTTQPSSTVETPQAAAPEGYLPRFEAGQPDGALGMRLGAVEGPDAYTGSELIIDPTDGTKRVWMVWAHWCPYCQEELPALSAAYPGLQTDFPDIEIATVTTSIDPSRGNPLDTYLDEQQFPFTVVVDGDFTLAGQMGVSAFPFWLITDGDGTVLFRSAGYLDNDQLLSLMSSLSDYSA